MIKYSQGATSLGTAAAPGAWDPAAGRSYNLAGYANAGHCYAGLLQLVETALQKLEQQGHTHELCGMLWHQGESDSGLSTAVYKDRLKEFITAIRSDLGKPQLPFLIGELIQSSYDFAHDSGIAGVNTNRPDALPATGDFTLLVWMKPSDPHAAQGHLFSNNNGQPGRANLHLHNGSLKWFHNGGVTLTEPNSPIFDGQWHRSG